MQGQMGVKATALSEIVLILTVCTIFPYLCQYLDTIIFDAIIFNAIIFDAIIFSESDHSLAERPNFICMYKFYIPMSIFGRNHI